MKRTLSLERKLLFKLALCEGIGLVGKSRIFNVAQELETTEFTIQELCQIAQLTKSKQTFQSSWLRLTDEWVDEQARNQPFITILDNVYPNQLKQMAYPPQVLFYEGRLDLLNHQRLLGFVGARAATSYAYKVVHSLLPPLIDANSVIVSGLAKGVDQWSHQATIAGGGHTIGVIGTGLDYCYPREAFPIFSEMKKHHLVISEYPVGTPPRKHHFPMRNRIIAGLADAVVVIEAKERSGALITAQLAMEFGRDVFAVPGDILSGQSQGCHQLILDGAVCMTDSKMLLDEVRFFREKAE